MVQYPPLQSLSSLLAVENLTKRFGRNTAVDSMNFRLDRPMMLGIIGRSGAGKSTFVKLVQRFHDVDAGAIVIDGQDVRTITQSSLRRSIALVHDVHPVGRHPDHHGKIRP